MFFTLLHVSATYFSHRHGGPILQRYEQRIASRQIFADLPTHLQYASYVFEILWLPDDGRNT